MEKKIVDLSETSLEEAFEAFQTRGDYLRELEGLEGETKEEAVERLVKRINSLDLRRSISIYSAIAFSRRVPNSQINWLHRKLLEYMNKLEPLMAEGDEALTTSKKLLEEARTRQDKIIGIDSAMQYFHEAGGLHTLIGFWDDKSERDWDTMRVILDLLGE